MGRADKNKKKVRKAVSHRRARPKHQPTPNRHLPRDCKFVKFGCTYRNKPGNNVSRHEAKHHFKCRVCDDGQVIGPKASREHTHGSSRDENCVEVRYEDLIQPNRLVRMDEMAELLRKEFCINDALAPSFATMTSMSAPLTVVGLDTVMPQDIQSAFGDGGLPRLNNGCLYADASLAQMTYGELWDKVFVLVASLKKGQRLPHVFDSYALQSSSNSEVQDHALKSMSSIMRAAADPELEKGANLPGKPSPGKIFNLEFSDAKICLPQDIEASLIPSNQDGKLRSLVIVAPRYTFTDLHWDDGDGWSTLKGGTKVWAIWPPTDENRRVLEEEYAKGNPTLASARSRLKSGILVVQRDNQSLWLPAFCPHAVLTLQSAISWGFDLYKVETASRRLYWLKMLALLTDGLPTKPREVLGQFKEQMKETLVLGKIKKGSATKDGKVGRGSDSIVEFLDEWIKCRESLAVFWNWLERKDKMQLKELQRLVVQMVEAAHDVSFDQAEEYWEANLKPRAV